MDGEIFKVAIRNVSYRKLRSFLTLLGIAIGIAAVVALVSVGEGLRFTISDQLQQMGTDKIIVMAGMTEESGGVPGFSISLKEKDVELVSDVKGVKKAIPLITTRIAVKFKEESKLLWVSGIPPEETEEFYKDFQNFEVEEGRWMKSGEDDVTVVGALIPDRIFPKLRLKNKLEIMDKKFKVIGVLKSLGNAQDDSQLLISYDVMKKLMNNTDEVTVILVQTDEDPTKVSERIEKKLDKKYGKDTFMAMTTEQMIERVNTIFAVLSAVLAGIAAISLLVAGFGILNTMLMSVMERTREIGIMKAIGATNFDVMFLFLVESMIVGVIGGLLGIIIGSILSMGAARIITTTIGLAFHSVISPTLLVGVVIFSVIVGCISGLYPAWRASRLDPVEALRYE